MQRFTRRSFVAASAVLTAGRAWAQAGRRVPPGPDEPRTDVDVIIIGAGAAGIAAARRLIAAGRRVVVLEAAAQVGGRCVTDTGTFGVPYDRGAHWIYESDINPLAKLAPAAKLDIYPAPPGQRLRVGGRYAREGETEDYLSMLVRASNAIADSARGRADVSCAQVLPKDLGDWRPTIEFFLGPFGCGKDLAEVSAMDLARALEHDFSAFCRQGYGALLEGVSAGLPIQLATPATRIEWAGRGGVDVETERGRIGAPIAIVTVSTNVLTSDKIKFVPDLPKRHLDAAAKLRLGSYDHITLELPGNPLGLRPDELVFEKASGRSTAALFAYAGSALCTIDVGGSFGRDLSAKGDREMIAFALDWLARLYGNDVKSIVKRRDATRWNADPWVLGASSSAAPGAQPSRRILMEPLNNRVFFAGEAAHETLWGTVGGAWESGERAADAAIKATEKPVPPVGRR